MDKSEERGKERPWFSGLYEGQLDDGEIKQFERDIELGIAARSYEGAGGLLGLAKVRYK